MNCEVCGRPLTECIANWHPRDERVIDERNVGRQELFRIGGYNTPQDADIMEPC